MERLAAEEALAESEAAAAQAAQAEVEAAEALAESEAAAAQAAQAEVEAAEALAAAEALVAAAAEAESEEGSESDTDDERVEVDAVTPLKAEGTREPVRSLSHTCSPLWLAFRALSLFSLAFSPSLSLSLPLNRYGARGGGARMASRSSSSSRSR
jgi:hypothetical protein